MSLPPDTGAVELRVYSEYTLQRLARGERLDGRRFDEVRRPTLVRDRDAVAAATMTTTSAAVDVNKNSHGGGKASSAAATAQQRQRQKQRQHSHNDDDDDVDDDVSNRDDVDAALLSAVMYTDNKGSCLAATVHGVLGPPRTQRPHDGRVNVVLRAPLLYADGTSGGGGGSSNTRIDATLLQLEGYVLGMLRRCLDVRQLLLLPGEACWVVTVTVTLLHVDGSLHAAALHAAVAALHALVLPRTRLPNGVVAEERPLRWRCVPVACTYGVLRASSTLPSCAAAEDDNNKQKTAVTTTMTARVDDSAGAVYLLADTSAVEEHVLHGTMTVALDEAGGVIDVCHVGDVPLSSHTLLAAVSAAAAHTTAVRSALQLPTA